MRKVSLKCESADYSILIGRNVVSKIGSLIKKPKGTKALIVSNKTVGSYHLAPLKRTLIKSGYDVSVFLTPFASERDKSDAVLTKLWKKMVSLPLERGSLVVGLGGGVIGDLAGFAAATYMRGISVVHVPTTLLAQVDSSIGGKTAIDLSTAKNIIGAFHQPEAVISDVLTLKTLTKSKAGREHLRDSFAEVIKYGIIGDTVLFNLLEKEGAKQYAKIRKGYFGTAQAEFLEKIVWRSSKAKAQVVAADEYETKGKRVMLNLGHTFAHGFEAASNYRLSHGAAVGIGIACAARMAVELEMMSSREELRIISLLKAFDLPVSIKGMRLDQKKMLYAIERDKKKAAGKLRFVLPTRVGKTVVCGGIERSLILKVIRESGEKS